MHLSSAFCLILCTSTAFAGSRTSASYSVPADTTDSGGRRTTSASYTSDGSFGGITGISTAAVPAETLKQGYIAQLYEPVALQLSAPQLTVNENSTLQLSASLLLDDATTLSLAPASVAWSVPSGPLTSISAGGLATAGIVYQNTSATAQGIFSGFTGTLGLTVTDSSPDNFGLYAGDGITDAWQVQYFGLNNPQAAAGMDPDADSQDNLFEFRAGYVPTNPASLLTFRPVSFTGSAITLELSRVQPGTRYFFERSDNLTTWSVMSTLTPIAVIAPYNGSYSGLGGFSRSQFRVRLAAP